MTWITCCVVALLGLLAVGANAYDYPTMPSDWQNVKVTVGSVTMPFDRYPDGAPFSSEKSTMTIEEQRDYGLNLGRELNLRGWECVAFARYAYAALFYKYPQNASIDTSLAYDYSYNYAYVNMIEKVLGVRTLAPGYDAATLKTLFTACQPGAVMRISGHSMVLMAIFDDGVLIYDGNFSGSAAAGVRRYTYESFVSSLGYRGLEALHMPAYYPGYSYSTGGSSDGYDMDTSQAGSYEVYNCSELNVRARPYIGATLVGTIKSGTVIDVLGVYNGWAKISYDNVLRWVIMDYLRAATNEVAVTFDASGGVASLQNATYKAGALFGTMPTATKSERTLRGWFQDNTEYTSSSQVPAVETLLLKAKWCVLEYQDVLEESWFSPYVEAAYNQGLISKDTHFNPDQAAPRCQMVTVLGREYERETGEKLSNTNSGFLDVLGMSYYAPYVTWGAETGIVKGMGGDMFQPDINVTREQIAAFLYRYAIYRGIVAEGGEDETVLQRFNDGGQVSEYARAAISWAITAEILQGDDSNCINPQGFAKRSEMVTMFSRYINYSEAAPPIQTEKTVTITLDANGGSVSETTLSCTAGKAIGQLPTASKEGSVFVGWFLEGTQYTDESIVPETDITLTARWGVRGYSDVPEGHWLAEYVAKCCDNGLLDGEGGTLNPDGATNRAEVIKMLGRGYESQTGTTIEASQTNFTDVDMNQDYGRYVAWAAENGLAKGSDETTFGPDLAVTRGQLCLFLYRTACFSGTASKDTPEDESVLEQFSDNTSVGGEFRQAMSWAVRTGLINGVDGALQSNVPANRGQVIAVMARYLDLPAGA